MQPQLFEVTRGWVTLCSRRNTVRYRFLLQSCSHSDRGGCVSAIERSGWSDTKPVGFPEIDLCEEAEAFRKAGGHGFPLPSCRDSLGLRFLSFASAERVVVCCFSLFTVKHFGGRISWGIWVGPTWSCFRCPRCCEIEFWGRGLCVVIFISTALSLALYRHMEGSGKCDLTCLENGDLKNRIPDTLSLTPAVTASLPPPSHPYLKGIVRAFFTKTLKAHSGGGPRSPKSWTIRTRWAQVSLSHKGNQQELSMETILSCRQERWLS